MVLVEGPQCAEVGPSTSGRVEAEVHAPVESVQGQSQGGDQLVGREAGEPPVAVDERVDLHGAVVEAARERGR